MVASARTNRSTTRVRVSKSGQMTLPSKVRKLLDVELGDYVNIIQEQNGNVRIESANPLTIEEFAGSLGPPPGGQTLSEYLGEIDRTPMVRSVYEGKRDYDDRD